MVTSKKRIEMISCGLLLVVFLKLCYAKIESPTNGDKVKYATRKPDWGYAEPNKWKHHDEGCAGRYQSPIRFWNDDVKVDPTLSAFEFFNYDLPLAALEMVNNGHTVKLEVPESFGVKISGGGLEGGTLYRLIQLHFHWGATDEVGSEHSIGQHFYPFEMHLVHIKEPLTLEQALQQPQGLAVLGVFFEHSDVDNNTALIPLIEVMPNITDKGKKIKLQHGLRLRHLLPADASNFFRYQGSLTTPPCSQVVTWTIFVDTHPITTLQLNHFRSVRKSDIHTDFDGDIPDFGNRLLFNHRPPQELYDRAVYVRKSLKYALPVKEGAAWSTIVRSNDLISKMLNILPSLLLLPVMLLLH